MANGPKDQLSFDEATFVILQLAILGLIFLDSCTRTAYWPHMLFHGCLHKPPGNSYNSLSPFLAVEVVSSSNEIIRANDFQGKAYCQKIPRPGLLKLVHCSRFSLEHPQTNPSPDALCLCPLGACSHPGFGQFTDDESRLAAPHGVWWCFQQQ